MCEFVVTSSSPQTILERQKDTTQDITWAQSVVPGFTVLFVFMTAGITALSIYEEKRVGSFRRLLAAPLSRFSVMVGKLSPNLLVVMIQIVVLFAASLLILPLLGSGGVTVVDAAGLSFTSMDMVNEGEPVCMLGLTVHILVAGATFNLHTRQASAGTLVRSKG